MITSVVLENFFTYLNANPLQITYIQEWMVPGVFYSPNLEFDPKLREKIVKDDDHRNFWIYTLFNRSLVKVSNNQGRRFTGVMGEKTGIPDNPHADYLKARGGNITVNFKYVSNSISIIEDIEEAFHCWDGRTTFTCPLVALDHPQTSSIQVGIKEFTVDSLDREDGNQYGSVTSISGHAELEYLIYVAVGNMPLIKVVNTKIYYTPADYELLP